MKKKPDRLRGWLNRNKVYFEIFASVLIGVASLVVSWSALRLNERILTATEITALPHFSIAKRAQLDPNTRAYIEETLVLLNNGAPVSNVGWSVKTFIVLQKYTPSRRQVFVPMIGYYFSQRPTPSVTGELSSIVGHENLLKFSRLYQATLAANRNVGTEQVFLKLMTVGIVTYEDRFGRPGTAFFRDYSKVSEESVRPLVEYFDKTKSVDINQTTLEEVLRVSNSPDALSIPE